MQTVKKVVFAFVVAFILIVSIHKAVAGELKAVPPMPGEQKDLNNFSCSTLKERIADFDIRLLDTTNLTMTFLSQAAIQYDQWYNILQPVEQTTVTWPAGEFAPLLESQTNIDGANSTVFAISSHDEDLVDKLQSTIESCIKASPDRDAAVAELQKFQSMDNDHLSSLAGFLSQMSMKLRDEATIWQKLEGQETHVPQDFFASLKADEGNYLDAQNLVKSNSQYVKDQYDHFVELISKLLLPLAQP